jgi:hypothetical protein
VILAERGRPELGKSADHPLRALGEVAVSLPGGDQQDELRGEVVAADTSYASLGGRNLSGQGPGNEVALQTAI